MHRTISAVPDDSPMPAADNQDDKPADSLAAYNEMLAWLNAAPTRRLALANDRRTSMESNASG